MITKLELTCPRCGAELDAEAGTEVLFCSHCGARILLVDENTYTIRTVDEAKVRQAETDHAVKMERMEMAKKRQVFAQKTLKWKIVISLFLVVLGIILMVGGALLGSASGDPKSGFYTATRVGLIVLFGAAFIWIYNSDSVGMMPGTGDRIRVPDSVVQYHFKNYLAMKTLMENAGFMDIQCIPLNDLQFGFLNKPGTVESISINGVKIRAGGGKFSQFAPVVITYHSFPDEK